ncbi:uncharacterized protein LAJ45_06527 [Morchella importuna]|uniref:uncharacterized protein n=1 Tax=Morchella importuna TaxID=1174673 RepID=UPI001E8DE9CE|nr:uncharacterized protein LAJ45_06527 [Morchella importuna]KAH8149448.1 hypothetical protein LAJ45_06527 [Morchella importuna]
MALNAHYEVSERHVSKLQRSKSLVDKDRNGWRIDFKQYLNLQWPSPVRLAVHDSHIRTRKFSSGISP